MTLPLNVMDAAYERFLVSPDKNSYLHMRSLMLDAPELVRRWADLQELEAMCEPQGQLAATAVGRRSSRERAERRRSWERFQDRAADLALAWRLCTRFHYLVAVAAEGYGDHDECELARFQLSACLEGILATGDGSVDAPFEVLHTSDICDVLRTLKKEPIAQHLVRTTALWHQDTRAAAMRRRRLCDIVTCLDGSEWYFDRSDGGYEQDESCDLGLVASRLSELNL